MQPDDARFISLIIEKTDQDKIRWEPTALPGVYITTVGGEFSVRLSDASVAVRDRLGNIVLDLAYAQLPEIQELHHVVQRQLGRSHPHRDKLIATLERL
jgi:hypothetical protein